MTDSTPDGTRRFGRQRPRHRRRRRSWLQRFVLLSGALSTLAIAGSAGAFAYLYRKAEQIPRVELSSVLDAPQEGGEPQNYLIVGVDNADGLPADDPVRRKRDSQMLNDVVMVLRIDPDEQKAEGYRYYAGLDAELSETREMIVSEALANPTDGFVVTTRDGQDPLVTDGPFAETKEVLLGYYLIDVPDRDTALAWAARMPIIHWGTIEVRAVADSPASARALRTGSNSAA